MTCIIGIIMNDIVREPVRHKHPGWQRVVWVQVEDQNEWSHNLRPYNSWNWSSQRIELYGRFWKCSPLGRLGVDHLMCFYYLYLVCNRVVYLLTLEAKCCTEITSFLVIFLWSTANPPIMRFPCNAEQKLRQPSYNAALIMRFPYNAEQQLHCRPAAVAAWGICFKCNSVDLF